MDELNRVVARFMDGTTLKGTTEDFSPQRPSFHVHVVDEPTAREVKCAQLKALFFVKDLAGDPTRKDLPGFGDHPPDSNRGKRIVVQFKDGETISGFTLAYTPDRSGFFVAPADDQSNNLRIFVFKHATRKIAVGAHIEAMEQPRPRAA